MLQTKDLVLIFNLTLLHWSCTGPFQKSRCGMRRGTGAGVSCAMDSFLMESELPCQASTACCSRALSAPWGQVVCGAGISGLETCLS